MDHAFGYTIFNDNTLPNYQLRSTQYLAGKNFRISGPLGPLVITKDALPDPHYVQIVTRVEMQSASTMHFDIPAINYHLSAFIDLEAGDVIVMGTPAGDRFKRERRFS